MPAHATRGHVTDTYIILYDGDHDDSGSDPLEELCAIISALSYSRHTTSSLSMVSSNASRGHIIDTNVVLYNGDHDYFGSDLLQVLCAII